ncbi:MAG TPA: crosslink repair DNA glycosylase YcaQ family protein [Candidatus Sulfomarinibacteraceae bacterium]|nr:crosslink repair DNA glycosylase YcaQ family protein [Candidatus Sulfomarinibacteraceae bacterium]
METLTTRQVRRLALCRAGLLKPEWTGLPAAARGRGQTARRACHAIIRRFGYLQLDSIAVAGARTHGLVLMSRLKGLDPSLAEELLQPGEPIFEYLGHEACWHPMQDWPLWGFRRRELRDRPRWGRFVAEHRTTADRILERIAAEGPLRSLDFDGDRFGRDWQHKVATYVASALWGMGVLAIRERRGFQRVYDLTERVIPDELRGRGIGLEDALPSLALAALDGHGWATRGTIADTWRLTNRGGQIDTALEALRETGDVTRCRLVGPEGARADGWIRPPDLELAHRLDRLRPRQNVGVLLSPFDPVLWDRSRVQQLFGFDQVLEIYKPAAQRRYGYYCLPVLAGDRLVARVDLKADSKAGRVRVVSEILEDDRRADHRDAVGRAVGRHARMLGMATGDDR